MTASSWVSVSVQALPFNVAANQVSHVQGLRVGELHKALQQPFTRSRAVIIATTDRASAVIDLFVQPRRSLLNGSIHPTMHSTIQHRQPRRWLLSMAMRAKRADPTPARVVPPASVVEALLAVKVDRIALRVAPPADLQGEHAVQQRA